jgi:hypothetical protein
MVKRYVHGTIRYPKALFELAKSSLNAETVKEVGTSLASMHMECLKYIFGHNLQLTITSQSSLMNLMP